MLAAHAIDYAQPSVTKIGGISEFRKVLALAEAANVMVAPHSPYFGPGLLATLHVLAAAPQEMLVERLTREPMPGLYVVRHGEVEAKQAMAA